tara:strand:+ start:508 stop:657 length:150 start_codon:yes stop_codon:yes gene_type:complete
MLIYVENNGYPTKLVFDTRKEAEYWGLKYSKKGISSEYLVIPHVPNKIQ